LRHDDGDDDHDHDIDIDGDNDGDDDDDDDEVADNSCAAGNGRETRLAYNGQLRPRVPSKKVELQGAGYRKLMEVQRTWAVEDWYQNTGPIQFEGATADSRSGYDARGMAWFCIQKMGMDVWVLMAGQDPPPSVERMMIIMHAGMTWFGIQKLGIGSGEGQSRAAGPADVA
jgi:hypothetical protein